jgi:hypothetical protein
MNLKLWRVVERFCRDEVFDAGAFEAFAQLVEEDQEAAIRKKVSRWTEEALEQLSFLISGTLDTVGQPHDRDRVLQCRGLYITGSEASLLALGKSELSSQTRKRMAQSIIGSLPDKTRIIIGSRIVPATWVHGFTWKQWRAGLARDVAMFNRPGKAYPKQAPESQAWILPVFVEKNDILADLEPDVSAAGVSGLGMALADALARFLNGTSGSLPSDVSIHPILAAAHVCWLNAKMIAVYEWARAIQTRALAAGRTVLFEERPCRGSAEARDARTGKTIATLKADASFPVDGTRMTLQLLMDSSSV